jgi:hypothetical protein
MLDIARYLLDRELALGFRSHHRSAGALLSPSRVGPAGIAAAFASGRFRVEEWTRIEVALHNGGPVHTAHALNDVFVGDLYATGTARYTLRHGATEEKQRSSGLVVATGAGSTGWYSNLPLPGPEGTWAAARPFARCSRELRYVVRDPICRAGLGLLSGVVAPKTALCVKSTMNADGVVALDGHKPTYDDPRIFAFNRGARLELRASERPLRVMCVDTV